MKSDEDRHGSDVSAHDGLGGWSRIFAGIVACIGLGTGALSVFVAANSAGSAALILTGAVFAHLAASGQTLRRLRVGGNEAEFSLIAAMRLSSAGLCFEP
jgi:hypothetical protein